METTPLRLVILLLILVATTTRATTQTPFLRPEGALLGLEVWCAPHPPLHVAISVADLVPGAAYELTLSVPASLGAAFVLNFVAPPQPQTPRRQLFNVHQLFFSAPPAPAAPPVHNLSGVPALLVAIAAVREGVLPTTAPPASHVCGPYRIDVALSRRVLSAVPLRAVPVILAAVILAAAVVAFVRAGLPGARHLRALLFPTVKRL